VDGQRTDLLGLPCPAHGHSGDEAVDWSAVDLLPPPTCIGHVHSRTDHVRGDSVGGPIRRERPRELDYRRLGRLVVPSTDVAVDDLARDRADVDDTSAPAAFD